MGISWRFVWRLNKVRTQDAVTVCDVAYHSAEPNKVKRAGHRNGRNIMWAKDTQLAGHGKHLTVMKARRQMPTTSTVNNKELKWIELVIY